MPDSPPKPLGVTMMAPVYAVRGEDGPPPSLLADRYEVLGLLGTGGMGRVYRVHDRALDEIVALKMLKRDVIEASEMLERFRREVKLARLVTSPHVVRTFDLGQHGPDHFLTMEYLEGRSLFGVIEDGPLPVDEALRIARALAAGIAAAHAAGVLHRDLKPDNVLVAKTGRIAITDFGIARIASHTNSVDHFVGTPLYMAPEQVDARAPISPATDVYAFGAIFYEMLTRHRPFTGDNPVQIALARLRIPPPDPRAHRAIPDPIAELVVRCLALEPADRPADGAALLAALGPLDSDGASTMPRTAMPIVPTAGARSIAVLPLRAQPDLADLADGLGEEIVDALTLTRSLRVRPMRSVRAIYTADADPREIGTALGVDVVVDGSVRQVGTITRIAARAISVADGFLLTADRVDAAPSELLSAGDSIARAVARALTVDLSVPVRRAADPRATALYLEGKAKLSATWMSGPVSPALGPLERAHALAPDDAAIAATLASGMAREAFLHNSGRLAEARALAEQVVAQHPGDGDGWLALGAACMYANEFAAAARALHRAARAAPGLALAQTWLGGILLEAGAVDDGIAHLEAALAIDPTSSIAMFDLARGMFYTGRISQAFAMLEVFPGERVFADITLGRFHLWQGRKYTVPAPPAESLGPELKRYAEISFEFYRTWQLSERAAAEMSTFVNTRSNRMRATRAQYYSELLLAVGQHERALDAIQVAVEAELHDETWFARCPILDPLREHPRFIELAAIVAARAARVRAAIHEG